MHQRNNQKSAFIAPITFGIGLMISAVMLTYYANDGHEQSLQSAAAVDDDLYGCLDSSDCEIGEFCHYGQCMEDYCRSDLDCSEGMICTDAQFCAPGQREPECITDSDCGDNEFCFDKFCSRYGADEFTCQDDSYCFSDEWCWHGICTPNEYTPDQSFLL